MRDSSHAPRGRLRLTAPLTFGAMELAPALNAFALRYAEIELDVSFSDRVVSLVDEGFDMAVRVGRPGDSSMVARKLCDVRIMVVGSPPIWSAVGSRRPQRISPGSTASSIRTSGMRADGLSGTDRAARSMSM